MWPAAWAPELRCAPATQTGVMWCHCGHVGVHVVVSGGLPAGLSLEDGHLSLS